MTQSVIAYSSIFYLTRANFGVSSLQLTALFSYKIFPFTVDEIQTFTSICLVVNSLPCYPPLVVFHPSCMSMRHFHFSGLYFTKRKHISVCMCVCVAFHWPTTVSRFYKAVQHKVLQSSSQSIKLIISL